MAAPGIPNWQAQILRGIGAPVTPANLRFLNAWARAEGGAASNNPFNTTQRAPGATSYNSVGVRNYANPAEGIRATIDTLNNGRYGNILAALRGGQDALAAARALAASPWGTGALVEKILGGGGPVSAPGVAPPMPPVAPPSQPQQPMITQGALDLLNRGNQMFGLAPLPSSLAQTPLPSNSPLAALPQRGAAVSASSDPSGIPAVRGRKAVNLASHLLGIPYVWGGESLKGFDCSGLLQYVWGRQGVSIPRTTYDQWTAGEAVSADGLQPGDAVFFKGSDSRTVNGRVLPGHVGIYIGGGKFIEAPHTGSNVHISSLAGRTDFMGARRYA